MKAKASRKKCKKKLGKRIKLSQDYVYWQRKKEILKQVWVG